MGAGEPRLVCGSGYDDPVRPDYVPADRAAEQAWLARAARFAAACGNAFGRLLPHMRTVDSARDLEVIRRALGQSKISFLGYSWGTYLGAVYATLFPHRVHRMVLDSVVRPGGVRYADNLAQNMAFDARAKDFFAWAARYDALLGLGATPDQVEKTYYEIRARLAATPARGLVGPAEFDDTYLTAGYPTAVWVPLALGLSRYLQGSDEPLTVLYRAYAAGADDSGHALYLATVCTDAPWPRDWARWRRDHWALHAKAPFMTWANAWFNAPCRYWPAPAEPPVRISGRGLPPVLLFQATKDAATPYQGALELHRLPPSSRLIIEDGGGEHGVTLTDNACLHAHLAAYLADGTVPADRPGPDARCAPLPEPVPPSIDLGVRSASALPALPELRIRR